MTTPSQHLAEIFTILMPEETLPPQIRTNENCEHWDSLFQLNLIASIEQQFEITVSDEDALDITSFETALALIEKRQTTPKR